MNVPTASNLLSLSIDEMISYYAAPVPIPPTVQPSTNPDVYMNDPNYMKGLNKQFFESYAVQVPNTQAFDTYRTALQNWAIMRTGPLPTPPSYVKLDDAGFNAWWAAYCMAYGAGKDAPPVNFIIPVAPLPPAPEIVAPVVPTSGSPIGAADGASIFMSSSNDSAARFPDGSIYQDSTGTYVKHIYITPFGTTVFWNKVA